MSSQDMPNYDEEAVAPMREELTSVGFQEMRDAGSVDAAFAAPGTAVVVINSVCGCAAGGARPGVTMALQNAKIPDRLLTSFAGQDKSAVNRIRAHLKDYAPSSPFIAVLKDGKPVKVMQRTDIEGKDAGRVANELKAAFEAHCARPGPSISPEEFAKLSSVKACGSTIPPATVKIQGMAPPRPAQGGNGGHGHDHGHGGGEDPNKPWWKKW